MKWEPALAMAGVIALGMWLVTGPGAHPGVPQLRPGARTVELRLGNDKGALEIFESDQGQRSYRMLFRDGSAGQAVSEDELRGIVPPAVFERATQAQTNWLFRLFNITSWPSLVWIAIGFGGQLVFSGRFLIQWIVSEKKRQSVVPEAFWWLSLCGGVCLFTYFVWRQDIVGVLGQSSGLVIYARNIRLIHKRRKRDARAAAKAAAAAASAASPVPSSENGGLVDGERVLEVPLSPEETAEGPSPSPREG